MQSWCNSPTYREDNVTCSGGVVYRTLFDQLYWTVQPTCDPVWCVAKLNGDLPPHVAVFNLCLVNTAVCSRSNAVCSDAVKCGAWI